MKLQTRDAGTPCDDHGDPSGDETSMQQVWDIGADETLHEKLGFNGGRNIKKRKKEKSQVKQGSGNKMFLSENLLALERTAK